MKAQRNCKQECDLPVELAQTVSLWICIPLLLLVVIAGNIRSIPTLVSIPIPEDS